MEQELLDFLKHIQDVYTDEYGNLQVCQGDEFYSPESIVKRYLKDK